MMENSNTNLDLYNQLRIVPDEAKTTIQGGRMNGKTNINAMWRIKKLTETFGIIGFGWKTKTIKKWIEDGANGEKSAFVDIELYIKIDGEWSEAIEGSGGSSFVEKNKNGLYTSDECFKMAYTDALSVACKALGIGADVYFNADENKYNKNTGSDNKIENKTSNIPPQKCTRVDYIKKIKLILWEVSGKNEIESKKLLEQYTSFVGKNGNKVAGVTNTDSLSIARLQATYGKIKMRYPEIAEKVKNEILNKRNKEAS